MYYRKHCFSVCKNQQIILTRNSTHHLPTVTEKVYRSFFLHTH